MLFILYLYNMLLYLFSYNLVAVTMYIYVEKQNVYAGNYCNVVLYIL